MRFYPLRAVSLVSVSRLNVVVPLLCMGVALLLAQTARAQVTFTLASSSAMTTASSEVFFTGTITNTSSSTIYLNGLNLVQNASTTPASGVFTTDSSPFYNNAPASLAPMGSMGNSYTGQLFGIITSGSFNASSQFNGTATLDGGLTNSSSDTLGTPQNFFVSSAMPEPGALALLASGLIAGVPFLRRRIRRRAL